VTVAGRHDARHPARRVLIVAAIAICAVVAAVWAVTRPSAPTVRGHGQSSAPPAGAVAGTVPSASAGASVGPTRSRAPSASAGATSARPRPSAHAPAPPPVTAGSRKGVSAWAFNGVDAALVDSGARWYYTWSTGHGGIMTPAGVRFVPMIWGPGSVTAGNLAAAKAAGGDLLGFNEPDLASQSNMTVAQALDLWPQLEATGLPIGSPAVAYGGDTPGGWLDQFMSGAAARGYRVDFIALHWYGGDFTTADAVSQLRSYLTAVYDRYHKPIWLTEFALIDFAHGTRFPTDAQQAAFVTASTHMLDGLPWLARYAWFALPADDTKPSSGLYTSGPLATAAGQAFAAAS
jgi:hypothetical protein